MKHAASSPIVKRLVLVGGGHSHLSVLKQLGMHPVAGLETVLVTRDINTPYSGALPGYLSGVYDVDDIHIDLHRLAQFAGARFVHAEVESLDLANKRVLLDGRPALRFDAISLNIGSRPDAGRIKGAQHHAIGVKPMDLFLDHWAQAREHAVQRIRQGHAHTIAIVGGGPASVELAFSAQYAINKAAGMHGHGKSGLKIRLLTADAELLRSHNGKVRAFAAAELQRRGIDVLTSHRVSEFRANEILVDGRDPVIADSIFFATGASIPDWPSRCGLKTGEDGFITVNRHLQSVSHPFVFACGDAATIEGHPRPKSGVYAVRQGKPLARNLLRFLTGRRLTRYTPQKHALALLYTGDQQAIASRHKLFFHGRWVWALKHRIDNAFLRKYRDLPTPSGSLDLAAGLADAATEQDLREHAMRCAGCAAKVGSSVLQDVLQGLQGCSRPDVLGDTRAAEDAALVRVASDRILVQTVDYFRAFVKDPFLFARIATNHCLGDIYAMGAEPHSALAIASVPFAAQKIMLETLREMMAGCLQVLDRHHTALTGGHSNEALEMAFGLSVNGFAPPDRLLHKAGARPGDELILCKPLGTGTLLAANMRLQARGRWMEAAFRQMLVSNREAAACLVHHGATACTDITGFGLAGHLLEMLQPGRAWAELDLGSLPVLDGALDCLQAKVFSSLHRDNSGAAEAIEATRRQRHDPRYELLFDPQTAGGLLASVPPEKADACLQDLERHGYGSARRIGRVASVGNQASIVLI